MAISLILHIAPFLISRRLIFAIRASIIGCCTIVLYGCVTVGGDGNIPVFVGGLASGASYQYNVVSAPHPIRAGKISERFEVRAGDCGTNNQFSDCQTGRERVELTTNEDSAVGDEDWYAWSLFIPNNSPDISPAFLSLGQFKEHNVKAPLIQFFLGLRNKEYIEHIAAKINCYWERERTFTLIDEDKMRGKWVDLVMFIRWSDEDDGLVKIWVNDELKVSFRGRQAAGNFNGIHIKYGLYRNKVDQYKDTHGVGVPTQVVYFDEVRKGQTREEVDIRMIEKRRTTNQ